MGAFDLDTRTAKEIQKEIKELARSYTPEWRFDCLNPDAGSVIALLFAGQMEHTIRSLNMLPEKYRVELVNLFGISKQPAKPAKSIVVIQVSNYAGGDVQVPCKTQLLGESKQGREIIFETLYDICVTPVKLINIFGISGKQSKIISYLDEELKMKYPIALFAYEGEGIRRQSLFLYHSSLYETNTEEIRIRFTGRKSSIELAEIFAGSKLFQFFYQSETGSTAFENVELNGDIIILHPEQKMIPVLERGKEFFRIQLDMKQQVRESIELCHVELLPIEGTEKAHFVSNGTVLMDTENFHPFGEQLAVYHECYIGTDSVFAREGAVAALCFNLEFEANEFTLFEEEKNEFLPIVKRKPKQVMQLSNAVCFVQEVSLEYYNGIGWKRLSCLQNAEQLFASSENSGTKVISFIVPKDWEPIQVGGYAEKCLRFIVTKANNCYKRPGTHYCPLIKNLNITYRYITEYLQPECLKRVVGIEETDITSSLMKKDFFIGFSRFPYTEDYMYLEFDKKFESGPISLFFHIREEGNTEGISLIYEYSSPVGFKTLQVIDHTRQLCSKGTILFWPPTDMTRTTVEGKNGYFIRLMQVTDNGDRKACYPVLEDIQMNAVNVQNVERLEIQEYTMDAAESNMSFPLYAIHIIDADVWVNEIGQIPPEQMKQMQEETPELTEAIYNLYGEIEEFYVKWTEVENFDSSLPTDRHYRIDRLYNRIVFGDGVAVKIPKNIQGIAFKAAVRCCSGEMGNTEAGSIHDFRRNTILADSVYNPIHAYGGSMPEDEEHTLQRGSNLLSAGKRLVTELDYVREIKTFSDHIDKVSCFSAQHVSSKEGEGIYIVLLMKKYRQGSDSFYDVKKLLNQHLLVQCEMTCREELRIMEPVFVHISVDVWLVVSDITETFYIQKKWQEQIDEYLEPVSGNNRKGWEIGTLPTQSQIHMMLRGMEQLEKGGVSIEHYTIRAAYKDADNTHEMILQEVPKSPFFIGCNGTHQISASSLRTERGERYAKQ